MYRGIFYSPVSIQGNKIFPCTLYTIPQDLYGKFSENIYLFYQDYCNCHNHVSDDNEDHYHF